MKFSTTTDLQTRDRQTHNHTEMGSVLHRPDDAVRGVKNRQPKTTGGRDRAPTPARCAMNACLFVGWPTSIFSVDRFFLVSAQCSISHKPRTKLIIPCARGVRLCPGHSVPRVIGARREGLSATTWSATLRDRVTRKQKWRRLSGTQRPRPAGMPAGGFT